MSIEKTAFNFLEASQEARSIEELKALFLSHLESVGADFVMCGRLREPGGPTNPTELFVSEHRWFDFYMKHHLFIEDIAPRHANGTRYPFFWKDIIDQLELSDAERMVMEEPKNFGLREGLVIPLHGPMNEFATVTVAGEHFGDFHQASRRAQDQVKGAIQLMANRAYQRATEIYGHDEFRHVGRPLKPQERTILTWVNRGKTNHEIATITGLSLGGVKYHIGNLIEYFDVPNRHEVVKAAKDRGLLPF